MSIVTAQNLPSFEKMEIYKGLLVIRETSSNGIIGYVNKHPYEGGWFYFIKDYVSPFYLTDEEAINELLSHFLQVKYDKMFKSVLDDERFVKK